MCMVNCCVLNRTVGKILFPWKILAVDEPGATVEQYLKSKVFEEIRNSIENLPDVELDSAFIGKNKDSLDKIELTLPLERAASVFGPFLKYRVCTRCWYKPPSSCSQCLLCIDAQFSVEITA